MADAPRRADAVWQGSLGQGSGEVSTRDQRGGGSASRHLGVTHRTVQRQDQPRGAGRRRSRQRHSMELSFILGEAGTLPEKLETSVTVTFEEIEGGWKTGSSAITVKGTVPGIDEAAFKKAAEAAKGSCPISRAPRATSH